MASRTLSEQNTNAFPLAGGAGWMAAEPGREQAEIACDVFSGGAAGRLFALRDEHAPSSDRFRLLANRLAGLRRSIPLKILHVTSATVGEGKSVIAANLAITLAWRPQARVLLIEGDLRRPSLAELFGGNLPEGIGDWWQRGAEAPAPNLYRVKGTSLAVMFAGSTGVSPEILNSPRVPAMLEYIAARFDWVVVDSPPVLDAADAARWAGLADGTLLVMRAGCASRDEVELALAGLDGARLVGTVFNESPFSGGRHGWHHGEGHIA
ncbi:MAG: CpsD/CapB family tyrosine-protein kinase [Acidobacteriota bacterium]|nr:CpsD/CapB family tyrosine-protein kinase [Acidobacteriota bacterium]